MRTASIWLTCHAQECTLDITPSGRMGTTSITFPRKQLVASQAVKVNGDGEFVKIDTTPISSYDYSNRKGKKKKKKPNTKGPDAEGNYDSYTIHLKNPHDKHDFVDLSSIQDYVYNGIMDDKVVSMRQFNLGQTRRRTRTMVTKVESYIRERRHKITLKENVGLSWKGILALVVGLFMLLITILVGQFWEEPKRHLRGPGARKHTTQTRKKSSMTTTTMTRSQPRRVSNTNTGDMRYRPSSYGARGNKNY